MFGLVNISLVSMRRLLASNLLIFTATKVKMNSSTKTMAMNTADFFFKKFCHTLFQ